MDVGYAPRPARAELGHVLSRHRDGTLRRFPPGAGEEALLNFVERIGAGKDAPPEHPLMEAARNRASRSGRGRSSRSTAPTSGYSPQRTSRSEEAKEAMRLGDRPRKLEDATRLRLAGEKRIPTNCEEMGRWRLRNADLSEPRAPPEGYARELVCLLVIAACRFAPTRLREPSSSQS